MRTEEINKWAEGVAVSDGYAVIMCTDLFDLVKADSAEDVKKLLSAIHTERLLELRVFDSRRECRLFRGDIGRPFHQAALDDSLGDFFDDEQYLDIDEKRSARDFESTGRVRATGGGTYGLPLSDFQGAKVIVRNYLGYDKEGQAYVKASRLVGFLQ